MDTRDLPYSIDDKTFTGYLADGSRGAFHHALQMPGFAFHAPTDQRSWAAMRALFDETLHAPSPA
ncbi:MAG TPA: hypothetical protein VH165_35925 [Kofleriaceae bacterium]|jgi:hypothetical protein|nr:hypothetical protein [Kofleriaceae bacterium]